MASGLSQFLWRYILLLSCLRAERFKPECWCAAAGTEEEVELRDDPSDLKVSTGGKALALPSPKLGSLSSSLKAL